MKTKRARLNKLVLAACRLTEKKTMKNTTYIAPSLLRASPSPQRSRAWAFLLSAAAILTLLLSTASSSFAGSATWLASPATGDWNTATNWTAGGPPNGPSDIAFFATSNTTAVSLSATTEVDGIVFNAGASAFAITASPTFTLTLSGTGLTNNSGVAQNFVTAVDEAGNGGGIIFSNSATAGSGTVITNTAAITTCGQGGGTVFFNTSTAGSATIINNGTNMVNCGGFDVEGVTYFFNSSTAGNTTIINNAGGVTGATPGITNFENTSTAGNASITNKGGATASANGGVTDFAAKGSSAGSANITNEGATASGASGGVTYFNLATADHANITNNGGTVSDAGGGSTMLTQSGGGSATFINNGGAVSGAAGGFTRFFITAGLGSATLIANGGVSGAGGGAIHLEGDSTGDTARVEVFGNGSLDISEHFTPGVTTGSIEGSGAVFLGANKLTVGNKLSTTFSGVMQDGGIGGGTGGSLTKVGKGKLTFTTANTYTGGTTITKGTLLVKNKTGSGTGSGAVQVNVGTLGGTGKINGAVTVGTGSSSGAILLAGNNATSPGTLTVTNTLTFQSLSTYQCVLNRSTVKASKVTALGVTINSNVPFTFVDTGSGTLTVGTVFTVINNTSANPISGTFSNLPDGSVFISNGNNFQANYEGGDGNDLTLTVVP